MYTVGQLSKKTGVSIRTLHYYEKLNLLKPVRSQDNQYRLYGHEDVIRLQQITVLKRMRFRLREIQDIMDRDSNEQLTDDYEAWLRVIERQITAVQNEMQQLKNVEYLLQSSLYAMKATGQVRIEEMLRFIREMEQPSRKRQLRQLFFTEEEMAKLPTNDPADPLIMEWADILKEVELHLNEAPDSLGSNDWRLELQPMARRFLKATRNSRISIGALLSPVMAERPEHTA